MKIKWKPCGGFTMVETVLSSLIMCLALLGSVLLMHNVSQASVNTNYQVTACHLAHEKLETVIADNALQVQQYDYVENQNYPAENIGYGTMPNFFARTVNVVEVADDLVTPQIGSDLKKVEVTVTWGNAPHERVMLTTLVTNYN